MHRRIKQALRRVVRRAIKAPGTTFPGSATFWEHRYAGGDNSGAGSYGRPAKFKAQVLNRFVAENGIETVIEFGCGDGNQLSLAQYDSYIGLDVSISALDRCCSKFAADASKSFYLYNTRHFVDNARLFHADVALSLDVIYHLVEEDIFEQYMAHLFAAADKFVIIYSTDSEAPDPGPHVRNRVFTDWVAENQPRWQLVEVVRNPFRNEGGAADFHIYRMAG